jgi:Flp pilus assembly protein TadG
MIVGPRRRRRPERGQATVELAVVLPVVVVLLLLVAQVGLLVRDRVLVVHAARAAARAVAVEPMPSAATAAARPVLGGRAAVHLGGDTGPGGLATVTVVAEPVRLPVVGVAMGGLRLRESLVVRVEGP